MTNFSVNILCYLHVESLSSHFGESHASWHSSILWLAMNGSFFEAPFRLELEQKKALLIGGSLSCILLHSKCPFTLELSTLRAWAFYHIRPTYLTLSTQGQPFLPRCIVILLNTDKDSFIWQVAWPLELIIDSNAIKKYNQVMYLHTVFSSRLHPCLHSPDLFLPSLRSRKWLLFVTTVLDSKAIVLCKKPNGTWCYCLLTAIGCPFSLHSLMEISPSRNPSFLGLWLSAMKAS